MLVLYGLLEVAGMVLPLMAVLLGTVLKNSLTMFANESLTRWRDANHNCSSQNIRARKKSSVALGVGSSR
jgi:hypothetical protein